MYVLCYGHTLSSHVCDESGHMLSSRMSCVVTNVLHVCGYHYRHVSPASSRTSHMQHVCGYRYRHVSPARIRTYAIVTRYSAEQTYICHNRRIYATKSQNRRIYATKRPIYATKRPRYTKKRRIYAAKTRDVFAYAT